MRILGIETSCDETAAAVIEVEASSVKRLAFRVLSNVVASQVKIHAKTGGVVPEVAARAHIEKIIPVVQKALQEAAFSVQRLGFMRTQSRRYPLDANRSIDIIAVTAGPGLVTALLVGVEVARTLAWLWKKPVVAVNHLAGHVYANFLPAQKIREIRDSRLEIQDRQYPIPNIQFPILCLIVSGGHTELVLMRKHLDFEIIGETRDDAAGEAFDKVAKMLGLGYPGGPAIAQQAAQWNFQIPNSKFQKNSKFQIPKFPRPMIDSSDFDFSFSGLKTAVMYYLRSAGLYALHAAHKVPRYKLPQICHEFQEAVVDVLVAKTVAAAKKYRVRTVLLGGGVAANQRLRTRLVKAIDCELSTIDCILPPAEYTTDNAAMIAAAGYFMARAKQYTPWQKLDVDPNWALGKPQKSLN